MLTTTIGGKFTWRTCEKDLHKSENPCIRKTKTKFIVWHWTSLRLKLSLPEEVKRLHIHLGRYDHYRSLTITLPDLLQLVALGEFLQLHRSQQSREWQEKLTTAITSLPMWTAPDDENDS